MTTTPTQTLSAAVFARHWQDETDGTPRPSGLRALALAVTDLAKALDTDEMLGTAVRAAVAAYRATEQPGGTS